jgi:hypothetical protein
LTIHDLVAEPRKRRDAPQPRAQPPMMPRQNPSHLVFTSIEVPEETPEEIEAKWNAHNFLCSLMRGNAEPRGFLQSIDRETVVEEQGETVNESAPGSTEEYLARIDEFIDTWDFY